MTPKLIEALVKFQTEVAEIPKNKINPFFSQGGKKAMYADLSSVIEICKPALNANNLAISQSGLLVEGRNALRTTLMHSSGETVSSDLFLPDIQDPQKLTAAITYLRRSQYLAILGLVADEDDDGNSVGEQKQKPAKDHWTEEKPTHAGGQEFPMSEKQRDLIIKLSKEKNVPLPTTQLTSKQAGDLIKKLMGA